MSVKIKKGHALGMLSMTPLIDIVFLLLIFFLVATRFAEEDRELDVILPSASEAQPLTVAPKEVTVNIDQQGAYFVGGKTVELEELELVLQQAAANNPVNQSVIIRADKRVPVDFPVQVINACLRVGIYNHSLTTDGG